MTATDDRAAVLAAALQHVPFDGWTRKALEAGAVDAGFPAEDAARFFPGGPAEAVELHSRLADAAMADALAAMDPPPDRLRDKVAALIRLRLEGAEKDREAVRLGLGLLAQMGGGAHAAASTRVISSATPFKRSSSASSRARAAKLSAMRCSRTGSAMARTSSAEGASRPSNSALARTVSISA